MNLKRAAATMNFLTEHGIGSYEELAERCDAVAAASIRTRESLRDTEQQIADLALLGKQIDTYRKLKPVYDRYKAAKDKEKTFCAALRARSYCLRRQLGQLRRPGSPNFLPPKS